MAEGTSDSLSSICGWVSIACWIVVYSPQIYENYALQSGEGLSVLFVVVWLLGDLSNLFGALMGGLLPTVIILALYYTACDIILLTQIYYYRRKIANSTSAHEREPLLSQTQTQPVQKESRSTLYELVRYTAALLFVVVVGIAAWWISANQEQDESPPKADSRWQVQALGWLSAVLYLGARIPQISKNFKTRCEGLHPALFFFAIFGNVTYALSICVKSMDPQYILTNAGWLAGSTLTVFLDATVLCQIFYYRSTDSVTRSQASQ